MNVRVPLGSAARSRLTNDSRHVWFFCSTLPAGNILANEGVTMFRIRILVLALMAGVFNLASVVWADEVPSYPRVTRGWQAAQALLSRMAQVYDVPPPKLQVDRTAHYHDGVVYLRDANLETDVMEAVLAHEFAHYLFAHRGLSPANEVVADARVVEILERARGYSRGEAFRVQYRRLSGINQANLRLAGHQSPCEELRTFLTGFPEFRDFVLEAGGARERPCLPAGW